MSGGKRMDDLLAAAAPSCHECGGPVQRVLVMWSTDIHEQDEDGNRVWRMEMQLMCSERHRVPVEPLE